jgi:cyclophilin family peptidyl-prolyl cis-trans isomerase
MFPASHLEHLRSTSTEALEIMRFTNSVSITAALLLLSTIPSFSQTPAPASQTPAKPKAAAGATAAKPAAASTYDRALLTPSALKAQAPESFQVQFETTRGDFTVTVTRAWSPLGADRFYNLVKHHYYDNARVFRVVPGFVAQFGISAYPQVTEAWHKATIKDDPHGQSNKRGTITFATSGPNTRTTQLFINLKDNPSLDGQGFTPFALVDDKGINIVEMFYDQYGDTSGMDQENTEKGGEKYLASKWPKLDTIKKASLVGAAAAPAAKPAATSKPAAKPAPKPAASSTPPPAKP